jgi:hypothetical protein
LDENCVHPDACSSHEELAYEQVADRACRLGDGERVRRGGAVVGSRECACVIEPWARTGSISLRVVQRGVVQGVELVRALILDEPAVRRKDAIVRRSDSDDGHES